MQHLSGTYKKILLAGVFALLFFPMIQDNLHIIKEFPLNGDIKAPENSLFNEEDWFYGDYQVKKETYLNESFGFRNEFVRLNNQLSYSIFRKANAKGVVIGKENYLYEKSYIDAYTGTDFLGEDSIHHTISRLKFISDTLTKLGKHLIVIFAPGKASFYPEYIPDQYLPVRSKTNYKLLSDGTKKAGLQVIDFNKWFIENKYKSKYPLYPKYSVHWSTYGTLLAVDSLLKTMECLMHIDMPNLKFNGVNMQQPHGVDYDIADAMNLVFKLKSSDVAYPKMVPVDTTGKTKPKVLVISDSFYWGMYNLGIANCFKDDHFWYYNRQVFPESSTTELAVEDLDLGGQLAKHDVFVIMATESTLRKISWGFIEAVEGYYKGRRIKKVEESEYSKKIKRMINYIKKNEQWVSDAKKRSKEKNISLDSMLILEAAWQVDHSN